MKVKTKKKEKKKRRGRGGEGEEEEKKQLRGRGRERWRRRKQNVGNLITVYRTTTYMRKMTRLGRMARTLIIESPAPEFLTLPCNCSWPAPTSLT